MQSFDTISGNGKTTMQRAAAYFHSRQKRIFQTADRLFAALMAVQWLAGIAAALWLFPLHVRAAIFLGGAISFFPILLALTRPGQASTRYTIAAGQMLMSGLLVYLTDGWIEMQFYIFVSLTFLAFYRDWRVLFLATAATVLEHLIRGFLLPQPVYGVLSNGEWRWLEHLGWVLFEAVFLCMACLRSTKKMWRIAERRASMDGLEVGTLVREQEMRTVGHLPINAMTAHPINGDCKQCPEAGMDGYFSKAIQSPELFQTIAEVIRRAKESAEQPPVSKRMPDVFDQAMALELMGDEVELLSELATLFANECPQRLAEISQAITLGDSKQLERVAHKLKGTASNFAAHSTVAVARQLEEMGRSKDLTKAEATFTTLEIEVGRLIVALTSYATQHPCKASGEGMQSIFPSASNRNEVII